MINTIIRNILSRRIPQIQAFMKAPQPIQESTFRKLVLASQHSEWGKKFRFDEIKNINTYQSRIPVSAYEDFAPYIERMMNGEQNILCSSPIYWFSKSSGTTNARSKFIPVSRESLQKTHFQGGKDLLGLYVYNNPKTTFFWGRGLSIGGTCQRNPDNPRSYYGDISGVIMKNLPPWAQSIRTPPLKIALMEKWEEKIEAMARITMKKRVTGLLGVPTWTIVLLQRILEISGKKTIHEVWPHLEVFMHGAVAFQPYRKYVDSLIGNPSMKYIETYNASEGFFGIQDDLSRDDMLLMLDYDVFYEFVPLSEIDNPFPKAYTIEEVELDKNYAMLITTNAGLWRYKIGDTVKFTSLYPHRIKITGRTKHFINAFGEEVIIENAEAAVSRACAATQASIDNYTAAPIYMNGESRGGHEWIVEFKKAPNSLDHFVKVLDETLREINSDYDAKRYKDIALQPPVVHSVPDGTFYKWLKSKGKLGGQHKVPRLSNSREYVEEILSSMASS